VRDRGGVAEEVLEAHGLSLWHRGRWQLLAASF
jgi:hypothetical protein